MMLSHNSLAVIHARTNSRTSSAVTRFGGLGKVDAPTFAGRLGGGLGLDDARARRS